MYRLNWDTLKLSFRSRHRHLPHGMRLSGPFPAQPFRDPADKRLSDVTFGDGKHSLIRTTKDRSRHNIKGKPKCQHQHLTVCCPSIRGTLPMLTRNPASAMQPNNMAADLKPQGEEATPKVKVSRARIPKPFDWNLAAVADEKVSLAAYAKKRNPPATSVCSSPAPPIRRRRVRTWYPSTGVAWRAMGSTWRKEEDDLHIPYI